MRDVQLYAPALERHRSRAKCAGFFTSAASAGAAAGPPGLRLMLALRLACNCKPQTHRGPPRTPPFALPGATISCTPALRSSVQLRPGACAPVCGQVCGATAHASAWREFDSIVSSTMTHCLKLSFRDDAAPDRCKSSCPCIRRKFVVLSKKRHALKFAFRNTFFMVDVLTNENLIRTLRILRGLNFL